MGDDADGEVVIIVLPAVVHRYQGSALRIEGLGTSTVLPTTSRHELHRQMQEASLRSH